MDEFYSHCIARETESRRSTDTVVGMYQSKDSDPILVLAGVWPSDAARCSGSLRACVWFNLKCTLAGSSGSAS